MTSMNLQKLLVFLLGASLLGLASSCTSRLALPSAPFSEATFPQAPDYSLEQNWAALPTKLDSADRVPPGVDPESQASAKADVFFIYPTIFEGGEGWNADVNDQELNLRIESSTIKHQTSPFNASCKVYAPRYRQMVLGGFYPKSRQDSLDKDQALELAYQDVKRAFQYYLDHYQQGRPIVIAAHSQGSYHGMRLLQDFFDGSSLQEDLVVAYLLGWPFRESDFQQLEPCLSPDQTGCMIGWATWKKNSHFNRNRLQFYKNSVVVNPLNWKSGPELIPATQHKGFLKGDFKTLKRNFSSVQIVNNVLWVKNPVQPIPAKNYHIADVNYFWMDIRENVKERVDAFLR